MSPKFSQNGDQVAVGVKFYQQYGDENAQYCEKKYVWENICMTQQPLMFNGFVTILDSLTLTPSMQTQCQLYQTSSDMRDGV